LLIYLINNNIREVLIFQIGKKTSVNIDIKGFIKKIKKSIDNFN